MIHRIVAIFTISFFGRILWYLHRFMGQQELTRTEADGINLYRFQVAPKPTRVRLALEDKGTRGAKIDLPEVVVNLPEGEQRHGKKNR